MKRSSRLRLRGVADPSVTSCDVTPVSITLHSAVGSGANDLWLILEQQGNGTAFCSLHTYETSSEAPAESVRWHVNIQQARARCWLTQEMYY